VTGIGEPVTQQDEQPSEGSVTPHGGLAEGSVTEREDDASHGVGGQDPETAEPNAAVPEGASPESVGSASPGSAQSQTVDSQTVDPETVDSQAVDTEAEDPEQRVSWLELFFDLVVVVAVAMIAERTHEHATLGGVAESAVMYGALWIVWTAYMLYANVEGDRAHRKAILIGMVCIAVMAAAIPAVGHGRDVAFAVAYIVGRTLAMQSLAGSRKAVLDWPLAQQGGGLVPFFVGFWIDAPARYYLWAGGILLDVVFSAMASREPEALQRRFEQGQRMREERVKLAQRRRGGPGSARASNRRAQGRDRLRAFQIAHVNRPHLGERLGLFTIIVLGEAVTQIVTATTEVDWSWAIALGSAAGFLALIGLWWLTFSYGFTGSPQEKVTRLRAGVALPVHLVSTAGIVGLSVGLGAAVAHGGDGVPTGLRWVGCAALALYFLASAVGGALSGAPRSWLWGWALPAGVVPLVAAGVWREAWPGWVLALVLGVVIGWMVCYGPIHQRRAATLGAAPAEATA